MEKILFFDGICVMCNGFIDFVLRHDRLNVLKFAPLQGETAKKVVPQFANNELTSVILKDGSQIFTESDAIIKSLKLMGGIFRFASIFLLVPKQIRDYFYRMIAKNRYRLFGKKHACRIPTKKEQLRLLL